MLYPPFKFVFECPSFPLPILNIFDRFSSNFELELIWKRSVLELLMTFCQITKELWPLIVQLQFVQYILNKLVDLITFFVVASISFIPSRE